MEKRFDELELGQKFVDDENQIFIKTANSSYDQVHNALAWNPINKYWFILATMNGSAITFRGDELMQPLEVVK